MTGTPTITPTITSTGTPTLPRSITSTIVRRGLRSVVGLALVGVLAGVPVALVALVGVPDLSGVEWRALWRRHQLSSDLAVVLGASMFLVLWGWFAVTALSECRLAWSERRGDHRAASGRTTVGPAAWLRGAVRFVVLSSVSAAALSSGAAVVTHAQEPALIEHVVVPGDSYWAITDAHLDAVLGRDATPQEVWSMTQVVIDANADRLGHRDRTLLLPGERVTLPSLTASVVDEQRIEPPSPAPAVPVTTTPAPVPGTSGPVAVPPDAGAAAVPVVPTVTVPVVPTVTVPVPVGAEPVGVEPVVTVAVDDAVAPDRLPSAADVLAQLQTGSSASRYALVGAGLLAFGVLTTARVRRGRVLRHSPAGSRHEAPSFHAARLELQLRAIDPSERMARLDVAIRAAARDLAAQGSGVLAVTTDVLGEVRIHVASPALPTSDTWRADLLRETWRLPAAVPLEVIAEQAQGVVFPCPALVQVGTTADGTDVFVDVEAVGVLSVRSPNARTIVATLAMSLAWSPWMEQARVLVDTGLVPECPELEVVGCEAMWRAVTDQHDRVADATSGSTFADRAQRAGEAWPPLVAFTEGGRPSGEQAVVPHAGVGVVTTGPSSTPFRLVDDGDAHVLEPFGLRLVPTAAATDALEAAVELVEHTGVMPLAIVPEHAVEVLVPASSPRAADAGWTEPKWDVLVTLLGQVSAQDRSGRIAQFEKAKALELVVWLTQHRERPTRSAARSALWDLAVRDSTFANVVSDCRRGLGRLVAPPQGEDWIGRTLTDDLPLHRRVVTDAELLAARLDAARGLSHEDAIAVLRPGVELLLGMPFSGAGAGYLWVDGEGHTSSLVLLATGAAEALAEHHLALGDVDGVFWATGRGLRVLAAHEQLISLRMRAHAMRGDTAGVRLEWEQYERALAADAWSDDEPSPKLAALRRELLAPSMAAGD